MNILLGLRVILMVIVISGILYFYDWKLLLFMILLLWENNIMLYQKLREELKWLR